MFLLHHSQHNIIVRTNMNKANGCTDSVCAIRLYTVLITSNINDTTKIKSFRFISSLRVLIT